MQSSGVGVHDVAVEAFQDLKLKKKYKYITFRISDDNKEIVVEKTIESGNYDSFMEALPTNECRYAVFDFEYDAGSDGKRNKILFYVWYGVLFLITPFPRSHPRSMFKTSAGDFWNNRINCH